MVIFNMEIDCPVCQNKVDRFDICEICDWQNNGHTEGDYDAKGPNKIYLWEAKKIYQETILSKQQSI